MKKFLVLLLLLLSSAGLAWGDSADLDELDLAYPRAPMENLTVGGQPSEDDLEYLASEGYQLVVNLRRPGEFDYFNEAEVVKDLGMKYINIPVKGMSDLSEENAAALHAALEGADGPVLLHCTVGMRASGLLGVEGYLYHNLTEDEAMELGREAHMSHVEDYIEESIEEIED